MATEIIPLITPSADRLCDIVSGQLQYVTRYEEYYSQLEKCMLKLQAKKEDVVRKLGKARRELKEPTKCVLEWLKIFETVEKEWMALREKRDTSSRCMNGFLPNPLSRCKMSKQIMKMTPDVNDLYRDGDFTEVADEPQVLDVVPQVTSGTVNSIESRKRIMNDMMKYLKDDNIRSIGVHGMGGIGKTTLVKSINDELEVKCYFKKVIMVTVSKDPNVKEIQGIIAERLGLELKENDPATRANKLCKWLKLEESVLMILDDMWNPMELGELGLRPGTQEMNCKFIITTRNVKVCEQMKVQKKVEMGLLSETESWVLFEEKAGPTFELSEFEGIAKDIVRKCKGSPLAIATLGSTLGGEENVFVWNRALDVLQNPSAMGLKDIMPEVVTSLTWSYDHLSDKPNVQLCFLYCCFFPEDSNISLADLRNYGIAEKFVKGTRTLENALDELLCHVKILKNCGLLLKGDNDETVKMHDVVRDVAIFIADRDEQGLVVNVDGGSGYLPQSEKLETCKRISLVYNVDKVLSHPLECPQLKSLMVVGTGNSTVEYDNLFKEPTTLSGLDIRAWTLHVMRIPESISNLKNAQTLYLSGCHIFHKVAILGGLTKLEVLSMRRCRIGNLTNLRYLNLSYSILEYVAPNVFSKLTRIEELYMCGFRNWGRKTEDGTKTNAGFIEVATLPHLSILEVETSDAEGSEGNPVWLNNVKQFHIFVNFKSMPWGIDNVVWIKNENMQKHLWVGKLFKNTKRNSFLLLDSCHGFKSVTELGADEGFNGLADLRIMDCNDLEKVMVASESNDLFWTLRNLYLSNLKNLEKIFDGVTWSVKFLGQLRSIEVDGCPRLSIIFPCNILFPEKTLEKLQIVAVCYCHAVQHVFSIEDDETATVERPGIEWIDTTARTSLLSGITKISLRRLAKLKSICKGVVPPGSLQGLTELEVRYCGSLQYLLSLDLAVSIHTIKEISVKFCVAMEKIIKPTQEVRGTSFFPSPPIFESLHCLIIDCCPKLKFLFSFGVARHLNQLHKLSIVRCPGLREIIGNGEEEPEEMEHNSLLPTLHNLQLEQLAGLTSFFKGDLPIACPLKEITVKFCPNLRRFPLKTLSSQTSFDAEGSWFRRLDENQTSVFERFVKQDESEFDTVYLAATALWSDDSVSRHEGMAQIWKILSEPELPKEVREMIILVVLLRSIVPIIVKLLSSHREDIRAQAVLALRIRVGVSAKCRDLVLGYGGLTALLAQLNGDIEVSIIRNATCALCHLFYHEPHLPFEQMKLALPALKSLIHSNDKIVCSNACEAISVIAADATAGIQAVLEADVCPQLMELLQHPFPSVVIAASKTIKNIALGDDMQIHCIIDHQVLPCLLNLFNHDHTESIKAAACWTIANIMCNSVQHIPAIIGANIIGPLVHQLEIGGDQIKKPAIIAIRNATQSPTEEVTKHLVDQGCLKPLCDHLGDSNSFIIKTCLEGLRNILQVQETSDKGDVNRYVQLAYESGGVKKIVNLQHHNDTVIQEKAANIVKAYHLEDTSPPSDTPRSGSPKGLAEELEGGEGNKLDHDKAETQVEAPVVGFPIASGITTSSSTLHGDTPLVEEFKRVRGNKLGHDNTESQEKAASLVATSRLEADDASPTDSFGLGKNKFPIFPERSDLATSSSFFSKPMQKHDLNSSVGNNDQSEGSASVTKQESSRTPTITETMKIFDAMDIKIGDRTYFRAIELFQEEGWREAFMCMSDSRRKGWLLSIEARKI